MVYYLRASNRPVSLQPTSSQPTSEMSESSVMSSETDTEKMLEKYYPSFLQTIYALAITFLLCHVAVKLMPTVVPFLTRKDELGRVHIDHKKAYLVSGVVGLIVLVVSVMSVSKQ